MNHDPSKAERCEMAESTSPTNAPPFDFALQRTPRRSYTRISNKAKIKQASAIPPVTMEPSLADQLMNDLLSDEEEERQNEEDAQAAGVGDLPLDDLMDEDDEDERADAGAEGEDGTILLPSGGVKPVEELDPEVVGAMNLTAVSQVGTVAKLFGGKVMKDVLSVSLDSSLLVPWGLVRFKRLMIRVRCETEN